MIECEGWSYRYPHESKPAFHPLTGVAGRPHEVTLLSGKTGSGKSTVLKGLAGILRPLFGGVETGRLVIRPEVTALIPQCSEDRHLCNTPREEAVVTGHFSGLSRQNSQDRWKKIVSELDLDELEAKPFRRQSGGERKKVAVALGMMRSPRILLLDEPLTQLDPTERAKLLHWLDRLRKEQHLSLVVSEHRESEWAPYVTTRWQLSESEVPVSFTRENLDPGSNLIEAQSIRFSYRGDDRWVLNETAFELRSHEVVALSGPNGSGKTTLLRWLAGLHEGQSSPPLQEGYTNADLGYLPQNPVDFFMSATLEEEFQGAKVDSSWIDRFGLDPYLHRHPQDLSVGQQQKAALALLLSQSFRILLLDEPIHGLDAKERAIVARAIHERAAASSAVVVSSHDTEFLDSIATRWVYR